MLFEDSTYMYEKLLIFVSAQNVMLTVPNLDIFNPFIKLDQKQPVVRKKWTFHIELSFSSIIDIIPA